MAGHEADLRPDAGALDGTDHGVGGLHGESDRLLDEDVDAVLGRELHLVGVGEGREADVDQVELDLVEEPVEVGEELRLAAGVLVGEGLCAGALNVAAGNKLELGEVGDDPGVGMGPAPTADDGGTVVVHSGLLSGAHSPSSSEGSITA